LDKSSWKRFVNLHMNQSSLERRKGLIKFNINFFFGIPTDSQFLGEVGSVISVSFKSL
jgi:hypothetical protein